MPTLAEGLVITHTSSDKSPNAPVWKGYIEFIPVPFTPSVSTGSTTTSGNAVVKIQRSIQVGAGAATPTLTL